MQKEQIPLIDAIRHAVIAVRNGCDSDREAARMLDISPPQIERIMNWKGVQITKGVVERMMPVIMPYLKTDELAYCEALGEGDWRFVIDLVGDRDASDHDASVPDQLAHWLEYDASREDQDMIVAVANRLGFNKKGQPGEG